MSVAVEILMERIFDQISKSADADRDESKEHLTSDKLLKSLSKPKIASKSRDDWDEIDSNPDSKVSKLVIDYLIEKNKNQDQF